MSADALSIRVRLGFPGFELDLDEEIALKGVTAIFGPSGSGKSTLLRAVAGFETPRDGRIHCGTEAWFDREAGIDLPPHRRPVGFMFQDTRLFDHLDVDGNLRFAEKRRRAQRAVERRDVVATLDLEPLLSRRPHTLSGGERQRVALARTLLTGPRVLLLDEPLTALDRERKSEILPYLERLCRQARLPIVYVSHSIDEVVRLASTMVLLSDGRVAAVGPVAEVMTRLDLRPMTGRFEAGVVMEATVERHDDAYQLTAVSLGDQMLLVPHLEAHPGTRVRLRIRARDVALATQPPDGISVQNVLRGVIVEIRREEGPFAEVNLEAGGARLTARLTRRATDNLDLAPGRPVFALIKTIALDRITTASAEPAAEPSSIAAD